jgi:hypothetical protein
LPLPDFVRQEHPMSTDNVSGDGSPVPAASPAPAVPATPAPPSWPWRLGALILAGAAQLITISALVGADRPPVSWAALLLAIAPAPLAAAGAFAPAPFGRIAAAAAVVAMAAGLVGAILHTGLFFLPALVVEIVAVVKLSAEGGQGRSGATVTAGTAQSIRP